MGNKIKFVTFAMAVSLVGTVTYQKYKSKNTYHVAIGFRPKFDVKVSKIKKNSSTKNSSTTEPCLVDLSSFHGVKNKEFNPSTCMNQVDLYCKTHSNINDDSKLPWKAIVNRIHKVLYVPVPKTGTTTWKRIFAHIMLPEYKNKSVRELYTIPDPHHIKLTYLDEFTKHEQEKIVKTYFKFTFVREPLQRIVSAFRNKFMFTSDTYFRTNYGNKLLFYEQTFETPVEENTTSNVDGSTYTFRSFVRYITRTHVEDLNEHWSPFVARIAPCSVKYDFIGKMENFEDDFSYVSKCKLNGEYYSNTFLPRKHNKYDIYTQFYETVDDCDLIQLFQMFKDEYEMFGYKKPIYVDKAFRRKANTPEIKLFC